MAADGARATRLEVDSAVAPVLLLPPGTLSTHLARSLLPDSVPHADAAHAAGRAALLVHALTRDPSLLLDATEDRLHQRQRAAGMPESVELVDRLRGRGLAAVVSGAGPSVLVLTTAGAAAVGDLAPQGWTVLPLEVDAEGARVVREGSRVSSG
jgi:homoserine kinase